MTEERVKVGYDEPSVANVPSCCEGKISVVL